MTSNQDPQANWTTLDNHHYKLHETVLNQGEIKNVEFNHSLVACASWGGPLAVTKDLQQINIMKTEDVVKDCIAFFSNSGKIQSRASYKETDRIVLFDYLEDELLILMKADGKYYICDPSKGTKKQYDFGDTFKKDQIIKAQVCVNGFVIMRLLANQVEFYHVPNAYEPQMIKLKSPEINVPPESWIVIPPQFSSYHKVEVHLTHPEAGIIMLVEDELKKIYYNRNFQESVVNLPHLPLIKMIAMSPSFKYCAYLSFTPQNNGKNWMLSVVSNDFQLSVFSQIALQLEQDKTKLGQTKDLSLLERPNRLTWCADDCVVLIQGHYLTLIGPDATERIRMSSKNFTVHPEMDGLRVITPKASQILRRLPEPYVNVFGPLSVSPGAMLFTAYESFEKRSPMEDDDLRSKKDELAQAVNDCIQAGQFEIQQDYQIKLLKAASYGKTFLGSQVIDPDKLSEVCKILRVQNAMRCNGNMGGRLLTYEQVLWLVQHQDIFVRLMLRYNLHYLANEITKYLNFNIKLRSLIYTHWACCRVESNDDDDTLCQTIKEKIKEEKGVSFTEIAHKAIECGKKDLALKLLDNEPSLAKRVPVLIWMATFQEGNSNNYFEKALQDAIQSRDSNLIYLVIMKFLKSTKLDENYTFSVMSQNTITQSHLMNYLRSFDQKGLQRYLQFQKKYDECAFLAIQQAYQTDQLPERIKLLEFAKKFFEDESKDSFYAKQMQDQIENLKDLLEGKNKRKDNKLQEKPLNEILESLLREDDLKNGTEFAKFYKVPDRRFFMTRAKTLIAKKNYEELERLVVEKNKKQIILPYEILADLLIKAGEDERAYQMLLKMQDTEEQVNIFLKIGQMRYAAQAAMNAKKIPLVMEVRQFVSDPATLAYIDQFLSQQKK